MKHLLTIISLFILLTACSKDDESPTPVEPAQRTVLVYMAGENNLTSYINYDIEEMQKGRRNVSTSANLVVFVDRISSTQMPYIAKITSDGNLEVLYSYDNNFYSSDPDNMRDVIERVVEACPAKEYGLVLWGHANGWIIQKDSIATSPSRRAYGVDNDKWLNIPSMRKSFDLLSFKWKFIFFDCCNMMNVESAYELKDKADYLIGSPAELPCNGAPYEQLIPAMFQQSEDFYKSIVDNYASGYPNRVVLSVVNTSQLGHLAQATKKLIPQLNEYAQTTALKNNIYYQAIKVNEIQQPILHDVREIANKALDADDYNNWMNAFNATVIYSYYSPSWITDGTVHFYDFTMSKDYWGGLSMFFPMSKYGTATDGVNTTIKQMGWYYAVGWSEVGW